MKNNLTILTLVISSFVFAQDMGQQLIQTNGGSHVVGLIDLKPFEENINIEGSPYVVDKFLPAKIEGMAATYLMRYNAAFDELEYQKGEEEIFLVNKGVQDYRVTFLTNNKKFELHDYVTAKGEVINGYLINLLSANYSLLKREKVIYVSDRYPKSSYEQYVPAKYERGKDEYYIKMTDGNIIPFPKNKKLFLEAFPSEKEKINTFLKENKISFKSEANKLDLIRFLSTI